MSNLIDKVYIPNTYKHGEYILKDIPFNVTYQSDNDILIENTRYNFLKNPYPRINIYDEHRFYGINSDIQDISTILKVTYDVNNSLKCVSVLKDGTFYPYVYRNLSDIEIHEKIDECIEQCSNEIILKIKEHFSNDNISRIFIYAYWEAGNDNITIYVGNEKTFNIAFNSVRKSSYVENVDNCELYIKDNNIYSIDDNEFLHSLTYYFYYVNALNLKLYHTNTDIGDNFHDKLIYSIEQNILKKVSEFATFTTDFKFIYDIID